MSPTRQAIPGGLSMQSRWSDSCSVNIVSKIVLSVWWRSVLTEKM